MTGISQQFCVRWNSHLGSLGAAFPQLLAGQQFVDVTLACDGHQVHCHRLVLAACSSYFESLLSENPCKHPIIILPKDIKLWEIHALVDFMYKGQVNVSQAGLPQLLKCAETLQIRGLCGTDSTLNEVANGKSDRCDALGTTNLLPNNCSPNFNFTSMFASNLLNANYQPDEEQLRQQQRLADIQRVANTTENAKIATNLRPNETLVKQKTHKHSANQDNGTKENHTALSTNKHMKRTVERDAANNDLNIKCEEIEDSDGNGASAEGVDDEDELSNSKQAELQIQPINDMDFENACNESSEIISNETITDSIEEIDEHFTIDSSISILPSDFIDDEHGDEVDSSQRNFVHDIDANDKDNRCELIDSGLPTSLKFNRNTMSISVTRPNHRNENDISLKRYVESDLINFENITCSPSIQLNVEIETDTNDTKSSIVIDESLNQSIDTEMMTFMERKPVKSDLLVDLLHKKCSDPLRRAVVLRCPRGDQTRTYTTDSLYAALMDVKSGESIYRASQLHGVPRKTLRNWMKRWHIKSVYPMPYQLKQAAEKKRQSTSTTVSLIPN